MTKRDSKLLSRWPEHQRRGKVVFVLLHGIVPPSLGVLIGVLAYGAVSPRHVVYWGGAAFMLVAVALAGGVRGNRSLESPNHWRQPMPDVRLAAWLALLARRGCADRCPSPPLA
jgi:hypothetical protein